MPPDLQIYLLGAFRLIVKGVIVPTAAWQKRKAKTLVQLLVLQPSREANREELIEKLFPEADEKTASARFYRVLYAARRAVEPGRASYASSNFLVGDGQKIKLTAANGLWIDADEFEQRAREGLKTNDQNLLESAAGLYRGDLLADEPFEDWIRDKRERVRTLFHSVLRRLAEIAEQAGKAEEAHFWLDKILQLEKADEKAHQAKMRLFIRQGERCLALRQYEKCADALLREFEVEPDEETENLKKQILLS